MSLRAQAGHQIPGRFCLSDGAGHPFFGDQQKTRRHSQAGFNSYAALVGFVERPQAEKSNRRWGTYTELVERLLNISAFRERHPAHPPSGRPRPRSGVGSGEYGNA